MVNYTSTVKMLVAFFVCCTYHINWLVSVWAARIEKAWNFSGTLVQIYVGSTWINNSKVSLSWETVSCWKNSSNVFVFLTVLQFHTTFRDILISVVVFTYFLKTKRTKLRCEVLLAPKVYFCICNSFSENQNEVSDKIVVANILWLKSTIFQNWQHFVGVIFFE